MTVRIRQEPRRLSSFCRLSTADSIRREERKSWQVMLFECFSLCFFSQIFLNGPVVVPLTLLNDFLVYRHSLSVSDVCSIWG